MRRYTRNRATLAEARRMRERFQDAPVEKEIAVPWKWPQRMQEIGSCEAVMYSSNKWKGNPRDFEDYKHVAEGPQWLLVEPGFVREYGSPRTKLDVAGPMIDLTEMPDSFAVLAPILGVQCRLYEGDREDFWLPRGRDENLYQIDIAGATLGGARHPTTDQTFLLVYTKSGVHAIIVGEELAVEKDGIVG